MLASIPLDVWVAAALAVGLVLIATFGFSTGLFILIYFALCAYIVVEIINDEIG